MSDGVKDLRSLPLHEIIGAPLIAIVQAQAQAARVTVEFIEKVGFIPRSGEGAATELGGGTLRQAEFRYTKPDETGRPAEFVVRVPVLSLVPIPGIQVKNARIAFTAKITDVFSENAESAQSPRAAPSRPTWLRPTLTQFRGSLAPAQKTTEGNGVARGNFELSIEVELEQMPIAPGLEKILNMMDQAISEEKARKDEKTEESERQGEKNSLNLPARPPARPRARSRRIK